MNYKEEFTDSTGTYAKTPTGTGEKWKDGGLSLDNSTPVAGLITGTGFKFRNETLTAAKTLVAADSGTTYFLNLVGEFTVTLPTTAAGLVYRFIVKTAPTTAYIVLSATADNIYGSVNSSSGAAEDTTTADPGDQMNFVASTAMIGDSADFWSDGTNWYARAFTGVTLGVTFTG